MKRHLKKLSSLCLALVLGANGFLSLNANAACRRIMTPEELEESERVKVFKLYNEQDVDVVVFNPLEPRPKVRVHLHGDEQHIYDTVEYCLTHLGAASIETAIPNLLKEAGENELAEKYEEFRGKNIKTIPLINKYVAPERSSIDRDFEVHARVKAFFSKNKLNVSSGDPRILAIYALIYYVPFDKVMEHSSGRTDLNGIRMMRQARPGSLSLNANAACRRIMTPEELEESERVKVVKVYAPEDRDVFVSGPLRLCPELEINLHGDERHIKDTVEYCRIHYRIPSIQYAFPSLLRKVGEEELAEKYKTSVMEKIEKLPPHRLVAPDAPGGACDHARKIHTMVKDFFFENKLDISSGDPRRLAIYALIYSIPFDQVKEHSDEMGLRRERMMRQARPGFRG